MENTLVLETKNLTKTFPGVQALKNVNFSLRKAEIHALVGENGAGKSTLVNSIMGLVKPEAGKILLYGREVDIDSPQTALKLGIGIVPQELSLVPHLSVAENIFLGMERLRRRLRIIDWANTCKAAEKLLADMNASLDVRAQVGGMSVAHQQLVQIARALAFGAKILILDEPTACLTIQETERLFKILSDLRREGRSIIYISHRLEEIKQLCDVVSVMRDGNLVATRRVDQTSIDELVSLMVGREVSKNEGTIRERSSGSCLLEVEGLGRKGEFSDISFSIKAGEILGVAGLVGAGRTELARCIFGQTVPDSGKVYWDGKRVVIKSPEQAIKLGIGYVPEERRRDGIFPLLSVRENITITRLSNLVKWIGINRVKEKALAMEFISGLNIKTPSDATPIRNLSGGNQQKAILGRWLARKVRLLILDEPTRGIDVNAKAEIHHLIRKLAAEGLAVMVISSELEELINLADRIMVMHEGKLKGIVPGPSATQEQLLRLALG